MRLTPCSYGWNQDLSLDDVLADGSPSPDLAQVPPRPSRDPGWLCGRRTGRTADVACCLNMQLAFCHGVLRRGGCAAGGRFRFEVAPGQFCEGQYVIIDRPVRLVFTLGLDRPGLRAGARHLPGRGDTGPRRRARPADPAPPDPHRPGRRPGPAARRRLDPLPGPPGLGKTGGEPPAYPAEQPAGRLITLRGQRARKDSP